METNATNIVEIANGLLPKNVPSTVMTVQLSHGVYDPWSVVLLLIPLISALILVALCMACIYGDNASKRIRTLPTTMMTFLVVSTISSSFALLNSVANKLELWMRLDSGSRSMALMSGLSISLREYAWSIFLLIVAIPAIVCLRRMANRHEPDNEN